MLYYHVPEIEKIIVQVSEILNLSNGETLNNELKELVNEVVVFLVYLHQV